MDRDGTSESTPMAKPRDHGPTDPRWYRQSGIFPTRDPNMRIVGDREEGTEKDEEVAGRVGLVTKRGTKRQAATEGLVGWFVIESFAWTRE